MRILTLRAPHPYTCAIFGTLLRSVPHNNTREAFEASRLTPGLQPRPGSILIGLFVAAEQPKQPGYPVIVMGFTSFAARAP